MEPAGWEQIARNLGWMTMNLFLAWAPVLFALHLRGSASRARLAGAVLVVAATGLSAARLFLRNGGTDEPLRGAVLVAAVAAFAAAWSWRARTGDRWARALGYVGVIAFAPNAPYVMTDLFHHVQDVRLAGGALTGNVLVSLQYGWFLVLGTTAWIALVDAGRSWLERHRPNASARTALVAASAVLAFGIYLGRIERFHSWHPLLAPERFVREVLQSMANPGPVIFTIAWWIVLVSSAALGLRAFDAARRGGAGGVRTLVLRTAWTLTAVLLVASPLVPVGYRAMGADVPDQGLIVAAASVVLGVAIAVLAWRRPLTERGWSTIRGVGATVALVPVLALGTSLAAFAQWHAQFRSLCEYGPGVGFHGDACDR